MPSLKLEATGDDLSSMWASLDKIRAKSPVVKVDPEVLKRVLLDHSKILRQLRELGE